MQSADGRRASPSDLSTLRTGRNAYKHSQSDGHRHPLRCQQRTVQPSSIALGSLVVDPGWTRCGPVPAKTMAMTARKPRAASWVRNWRQVSGSTSGEPATHPPEAESAEDQSRAQVDGQFVGLECPVAATSGSEPAHPAGVRGGRRRLPGRRPVHVVTHRVRDRPVRHHGAASRGC
jgi:hypothetical protein